MQKTRFGISVGLLGAAVCFIGFFGGYFAAVLLTGYILMLEKNAWLKRTAVKVIAIMVLFSLLGTIVNLIPNIISFINYVAVIFHRDFSVEFLTQITTVLSSGIDIVEKVLFIGFGFRALNQGTIVIPVIDKLISEQMN